MDKYDFHKISESADVEVFQAMTPMQTKTNEVTGQAPRRYAPLQIDTLDGATLDGALQLFDGYEVLRVELSKDEGVTVVVKRSADDTYEVPEPGVIRLETKKVGDDGEAVDLGQ